MAKGGTRPGAGRPKGSRNKITENMRKDWLAAFKELGGMKGLVAWGKDNKTEFYKLSARLIPSQIEGDVKHDHTHDHVHTAVQEVDRRIAELCGDGEVGDSAETRTH